MKNYTLPSRPLSLDDSWDVIVVGGGPAGCAAAASAAREGAKTLLVESTGALGGMGTSGLVPAWTPYSNQERIIYCGISERVFTECKAGMPHIDSKETEWVAIDPERLKRIYDDLVLGAGVTILFNTALAGVEMENGGRVSALVLNNKKGLSAYRAKVYVDCTGDADLSTWAGAEFHKGNAAGEKLMPATHCFILTNVDEYAFNHGPGLHAGNANSPIYGIVNSGKYPLIQDCHVCASLIGPRTVGFNAGHVWNVDNTEPQTVSEGLVRGRKLAQSFRDALAEYFPAAFANAYLVATGSLLGIRETRRIVGDYELTLTDYMNRQSFPDEICRNNYFIDIHNALDEVMKTPEALWKWEEKTTARYKKGESHGIPYRCLAPRGLANVLVAGRSISCEQAVQGSVRVMPVCLAMGEAAGMAAAHASKMEQPDVHAVDTEHLRCRLREEGAYLP